MKRRYSDRRLKWLVKKALQTLEDPAAWFYRDKTSFETKYEADCGKDSGNEPAWVSDGGRGKYELESVVAATVDGDEDLPLWLVLWHRKRLELPPKRRAILDALAVDWRSRPAAKIASADHKTVDLCKKIFKTHFAQCFQAWKSDFWF